MSARRYDVRELQDEMCHAVRRLNNQHLSLAPGARCPFRIGPCADGTMDKGT